MSASAATLLLGLSQLVCWGISYYLVGVFGDRMAADFGWSRSAIHGGFSLALLVMGLLSRLAGRLVDEHGGRPVMMAGSGLLALGCLMLALSREAVLFYTAWIVLGLAMRLTLYDAAFATLVHLRGAEARRPIAQITLLGGLASTVFWPVGHALEASLQWRGAVLVYAAIALATVALHACIPRTPLAPVGPPATAPKTLPAERRMRPPTALDAGLFALVVALASFLNAAMSAHMIGLLVGVGLGAASAVWVSAWRGVGQSLARGAEVLFGARLSPLTLNLGASALTLAAFILGPLGGWSLSAALAFAFLYGCGNGLLTITRGTVPLVLFSSSGYGALVGRLLAPSFFVAAAAPLAIAWIMSGGGERVALMVCAALALVVVAASALLLARARRP